MAKPKYINCKLKKMIKSEMEKLAANNFDFLVNTNNNLKGSHYLYLLFNIINDFKLLDE